MKTINHILIGFTITLCQNGLTQGFINLNFEDANLSGYSAGSVPTSDAIPGWTAYIDGVSQTDIVYDELSLGDPSVAIFDINALPAPLDGAFSVDLYGGVLPTTGVSIGQTGFVPANTASILFIAQPPNPLLGGPMLVSLGGQNIAFSAISIAANYTLYGGNIPSGLADKSEQLTFSAEPSGGNNYWEIDDIQFSGSPIPEPSSFGLFALGGLLLAWRHWRKALPIVSPESSPVEH